MLTSYFVAHVEEGIVVVGVGAAPLSEILALAPSCSATVFVVEPVQVDIRVRCGTAEFTESDIVPRYRHPSERVGAWLRVLPIADKALAQCDRMELSQAEDIEDWFVDEAVLGWHRVTPEDGRRRLEHPRRQLGDTALLLRGQRAALTALLEAIGQVVTWNKSRHDA